MVRTVRDDRYAATRPDSTEMAVKEKSRNMAFRPVMKNTAMPASTCRMLMTMPTIRALRSMVFWCGIGGPSILHGMSASASARQSAYRLGPKDNQNSSAIQ